MSKSNQVQYQTQSFPYWTLGTEDALSELKSDAHQGLSDTEAVARQKQYGLNQVSGKEGDTPLAIVFRQIKSPLIFILLLAAVVTMFLGEWFDASIILLAITVNTVLGFYQEYKAETALKHLRSFITVRTRVLRGGREVEIDANDVVPGDIVHLTLGGRVPADGRVLSVQNLRIDEAILTGESLPVAKHTRILSEETPLPDRHNMVFGGTLVAEGGGLILVTATGMQAEFGKIAAMVSSTSREQTPLQKAVAKLAWIITIIISFLVTLVFALGVARGESVFEMFLVSIAVAVGAIPEALPIGLTAVLAVGVERLAKRKGIMRSLTAAETLGSTTLVITDKTGTLTQARLQLIDVFPKPELLQNEAADSSANATRLSATQYDLLSVALANTDVAVENPEDPPAEWRMSGSALEKAIVQTSAEHGIKVPLKPEDRKFRLVLPFSSAYKFSVSEGILELGSGLVSTPKGYARIVMGAPDILLDRSALSKDDYISLSARLTAESEAGKRLVGVALAYINSAGKTHGRPTPEEITELEFLGVIGFFDPVREEVPEAISRIEEYGVRVVMATGDLPGTAVAIAAQLGWTVKESEVLTGTAVAGLSDDELYEALAYVKVFARVTPKDKLRIAKLFQSRGEVVAMTGDGVNDAPSLKAVDIGIAVGSGSDVAKATADLVILDDNFKTIVSAIEEGKRLLRNIRKTFTYLMSSSLDEVFLIGGSLLVGISMPLNAMQIIWVNFFTDSLPAIAFAFDEDVEETSKSPTKDSRIITGRVKYFTLTVSILSSIVLFGMYYLLLQSGFDPATVRTFIFTCFGVYTLFIAYSFRSLTVPIYAYNPFSNQLLNFGMVFGMVMLLITLYIPALREIFDTVPLGIGWWVGIVAFVASMMLLVEVAKYLFRPR